MDLVSGSFKNVVALAISFVATFVVYTILSQGVLDDSVLDTIMPVVFLSIFTSLYLWDVYRRDKPPEEEANP